MKKYSQETLNELVSISTYHCYKDDYATISQSFNGNDEPNWYIEGRNWISNNGIVRQEYSTYEEALKVAIDELFEYLYTDMTGIVADGETYDRFDMGLFKKTNQMLEDLKSKFDN